MPVVIKLPGGGAVFQLSVGFRNFRFVWTELRLVSAIFGIGDLDLLPWGVRIKGVDEKESSWETKSGGIIFGWSLGFWRV